MPPTRKIPQNDKLKRWDALETIKVLQYINDHFDSWCDNHNATCVSAIKVNKLERDPKAVYNKVYNMTKIMEDFVKTKQKANTCDIIWQNKKIFFLLKEINKKSENERKRKENKETTRVEVITNSINQITKERRKDNQETIRRVTTKLETTNTDRALMDMEVDNQSSTDLQIVDNLKETVDAMCKEFRELTGQIDQGRSELRDMKGRMNQCRSKLEETEEKYFQLRSELKEMESKVGQQRSECKEIEEKISRKRLILKEKEDKKKEILKQDIFKNFFSSK